MSENLTAQQLAEIRNDLDAVPAPPWRWIGNRHSGGPQLVTDHSGRQYLLRAAKPTDAHGDELLDPETDYVIYGDLEFRDQREGEKYSTMRPGNSLAIGRTEYDPDSIVGVANPVARWIEKSAAHAKALLDDNDRLRAEVARLRASLDAAQPLDRADVRAEAFREGAEFFDRLADAEPDQGYRFRVMRGAANDMRRLAAKPTTDHIDVIAEEATA